MFYVYRHIRLDKNVPFYVGKGSGNRAMKAGKNRNKYWQNIVNLTDFKVEIVNTFKDENEAYEFEHKLISVYKKLDLCGANITAGGKGGACRPVSTQTRRKISNALRGSKLSGETIEKLKLKRAGRKPRLGQKQSLTERRNKALSVSKYLYKTPKGEFHTSKEVANLYGVSYHTIIRWCKNKSDFKLIKKEKNNV